MLRIILGLLTSRKRLHIDATGFAQRGFPVHAFPCTRSVQTSVASLYTGSKAGWRRLRRRVGWAGSCCSTLVPQSVVNHAVFAQVGRRGGREPLL
jgi:hypothetical protein